MVASSFWAQVSQLSRVSYSNTALLPQALVACGVIENALDLPCEVFTRCRSRQHVAVYAVSHKATDTTNVSSEYRQPERVSITESDGGALRS